MAETWLDSLSIKLKNLQDVDSGVIKKSDVDTVIKEFLDTLDLYVSVEQRRSMFEQMAKVSQQITGLKKEISIMGENILKDDFIPEISTELNAVISQTEKSVIGILDVSDEIGKISAKVIDLNIKEELLKNSTKILELCNFQDLTGQIIHRIIKRLTMIEATVNRIVVELDQDCQFSSNHHVSENSLLNGPQKEADRPSQNEIDDLFSSLPGAKL